MVKLELRSANNIYQLKLAETDSKLEVEYTDASVYPLKKGLFSLIRS